LIEYRAHLTEHRALLIECSALYLLVGTKSHVWKCAYTHIYRYDLYTYIYVCMRVCVCMCASNAIFRAKQRTTATSLSTLSQHTTFCSLLLQQIYIAAAPKLEYYCNITFCNIFPPPIFFFGRIHHGSAQRRGLEVPTATSSSALLQHTLFPPPLLQEIHIVIVHKAEK